MWSLTATDKFGLNCDVILVFLTMLSSPSSTTIVKSRFFCPMPSGGVAAEASPPGPSLISSRAFFRDAIIVWTMNKIGARTSTVPSGNGESISLSRMSTILLTAADLWYVSEIFDIQVLAEWLTEGISPLWFQMGLENHSPLTVLLSRFVLKVTSNVTSHHQPFGDSVWRMEPHVKFAAFLRLLRRC